MSFAITKEAEVVVVDVEGQLIVGNRQELKQKVLDELEREAFPESVVIAKRRSVLDRRGHSPLAVVADAAAAGGAVLAVCADSARRLAGLRARTSGFALISYHALGCEPLLAEGFAHLVALDPPQSGMAGALIALLILWPFAAAGGALGIGAGKALQRRMLRSTLKAARRREHAKKPAAPVRVSVAGR